MSEGADAAAVRPGGRAVAGAFTALLVLTSLELIVAAGMEMERAARITTLAGLLMAKVWLVVLWVMRARDDRSAARLTLTAIGFAAGAAVVLMLESVFRVRVR